MDVKLPAYKSETNPLYFLPRFALIALLFWLFSSFTKGWLMIICVFAVFFFITIGIKLLILKDNYKGVQLAKKQKIEEAMQSFQDGLNYLSKHSWIDKYRWLVLFSASKYTYREIIMCNVASCLIRMNRKDEASILLNSINEQYPGNKLASAMITIISRPPWFKPLDNN